MFNHLQLGHTFPTLKVKQTHGRRWYQAPSGVWLPSVTTVLGDVEPQGLKDWRMSLGDDKAKKEMNRAADRGTAVHTIIEKYLDNDEDHKAGQDLDNIKLFNQVKLALKNIDNIHYQEVALYSERLGVAGRVDCIGEYKGVLSIIDFKTSNNTKYDDKIENYYKQTTAYALMYMELTDIVIEDIVIIIAVEKGMAPMVHRKKIDPYVAPLLKTINTFTKKYRSEQ